MLEGQKKIVLQVEKLGTEALINLAKDLGKQITAALPLLEPLMQSFIESIDKSLQDRLEKAYQRVMDAVVRNSVADVDDMVAKEARAVVTETDVSRPVANASPRASRLAAEWRARAAELDEGAARLTREMQVSTLINGLGGPAPQAAAEQLRALGRSLSQARVQQLVDTMNSGKLVIGKNAAIVVRDLDSPYVTPELREQARIICGCIP